MATTVKSSCPICGDVELPAADMLLVIHTITELSNYRFDCPTCHDEVRKPADAEVIALLIDVVRVERIEVPAEALEEHNGAPLREADLDAFLAALGGTDLLAGLAEPPQPA